VDEYGFRVYDSKLDLSLNCQFLCPVNVEGARGELAQGLPEYTTRLTMAGLADDGRKMQTLSPKCKYMISQSDLTEYFV